MSSGSPGISSSPAVTKRGRCRSPVAISKISSAVTPGTRCLVFLRRCLAIQLQKVGLFPSNNLVTSCSTAHFENTLERDAPLYWMYDSGYLIFQVLLRFRFFNSSFFNFFVITANRHLEVHSYIFTIFNFDSSSENPESFLFGKKTDL